MKLKRMYLDKTRKSIIHKLISSSLIISLLSSNTSSLASILSEDGRYETFEGNNITIDNVIEEDNVDVEIEGNTMVNYTQDGDKELILNGDIDLEGNYVTTTEGVDGGLVDIEIEGNTLVNLSNLKSIDTTRVKFIKPIKKLEVGKTYSIIFDISDETTSTNGVVGRLNYVNDGTENSSFSEGFSGDLTTIKGKNIIKWKVRKEPTEDTTIEFWTRNIGEKLCVDNILLLEGDWTNREIPKYFEGIKSVGQDDVDSHKIEIASNNKNLWDGTYEEGYIGGGGVLSSNFIQKAGYRTTYNIRVKPNTTYKKNLHNRNCYRIYNKEGIMIQSTDDNPVITTVPGAYYMRVYYHNDGIESIGNIDELIIQEVVSEDMDINYKKPNSNKKEILLNEPLRGINYDVKDRIIKKDDKWYIERKLKEIVLDGSENWHLSQSNNDFVGFYIFISDINAKPYSVTLNDRFTQMQSENWHNLTTECAGIGSNAFGVVIEKDKISSPDTDSFKQWLNENPITLIYELESPMYEILDLDLTLNTYSDITYIFNNSAIPANIKVKNTRYNVILKPNTEYTVVVNTDKPGSIVMNLGGAKGETSNNLLILTTPETLVDNSLRLYGKDIKVKNIRVLEGNKVDNIPSYFRGIQSSFENNKIGDNYEVKIQSSNKNLFDSEYYNDDLSKMYSGHAYYHYLEPLKLKPKTKYLFTFKDVTVPKDSWVVLNIVNDTGKVDEDYYNIRNKYNVFNYKTTDSEVYTDNIKFIFTTDKTGLVNFSCYSYAKDSNERYTIPDMNAWFTNIIEEISIIEYKNTLENYFVENKNNYINFLMNQPLRAIGDVKDRVIKRNGQWVIERNLKEIVLDGSKDESWTYVAITNENYVRYSIRGLKDKKKDADILADRLYRRQSGDKWEGWNTNSQYNDLIYIYIDYNKLGGTEKNLLIDYLEKNPIKVIYQLENSIYEPLNISPTLSLYEDITHISNNSNIPTNMKVTIDRTINRATEAIELAKTNPTRENVAQARYWSNLLKESALKDEIQSEISDIVQVEDMQIERKTATANLDVYVKSSNMLSMSLNTNSVTFEDYSGVENAEMLDAVKITINSSLPYTLNAYLESNIENTDKTSTIEASSLNIREDSQSNYEAFRNTIDKIVLKESCDANTEGNIHNIDIMMAKDTAHKPDVYKATVKFEAIQK